MRRSWFARGLATLVSTAMAWALAGCSNRTHTVPVAAATPAVVTTQTEAPANIDPAEIERQLLVKVNDARGNQSLPLLAQDPALQDRARERCRELAQSVELKAMAPSTSEMSTRMQRTGAKNESVGENVLRLDSRARDIPDQAVRSWMEMDADRTNLLSPKFSQTGIGVERATDGRIYITEDFAS